MFSQDKSKLLLIVIMLIGGTAFSTARGIKIARLLLIFNKLINNKKYTSTVNDKNQQTFPSFISATAIQFRKRNKRQISKPHIIKVKNKQNLCL